MKQLSENVRKVQGTLQKEYSYSKPRFENGDTLFARITPCLENGKTAFVDILDEGEAATGSTEFLILSPTEEILSKFVYYTARRPDVRQFAIKRMTGSSGRQRVPTDVFDNLTIDIPPIEEQERIVDILDAIDSKIENNEGIFTTLEEIGYQIYKNRFIHSGNQQPFAEIAEFNDGKAIDTDDWVDEEGEPIIKISELNTGISATTDRIEKEVEPKYYLSSGDVLFAWSASLGIHIWRKDIGVLNQHIFNVRPKRGYSKPFLYYSLKYRMDEFKNLSHGTTTKHISRDALDQIETDTGSDELRKEFDRLIKPLYQRMCLTGTENQRLESLRDLLLPKLLTGELRISANKNA
jgi:type I restriction enzyme S subunit